MRVITLSIFVLSLFLGGCGNKSQEYSQTLRINIGDEIATIDPRQARDLNAITTSRMLFEGLTRISKVGKAEMAIAESVDVSGDGLIYTFHLRKSFWSNGDAVTSYDFANSWKAILSPDFPTDIAYQLYVIKNGRKAKLSEISVDEIGLKTPDSATLIVELEQPTPYFLDLCSMSSFFPVPSNVAQANPLWASEPKTFVGNGPFVLKSWDRADRMELEKNRKYWNESEVSLSNLELIMVSSDTEIRMFEEGKLDWAGSPLSVIPPDAIRALKEADQLKVSPLSGTSFLRINTNEYIGDKKNVLANPELRKVLSVAIDRESITTHILQGGQKPAYTLVPPEMNLSTQSLQKKVPPMIWEGEITEPVIISFSSSSRNLAIAQAIQKQWEDLLGIKVELNALESKVFFQNVKEKKFQVAFGSWVADFNDPINFLEVFKYKDGSTNNTGWENSKYIDLLELSGVCGNQDERMQLMSEAEAILVEQMPIIPIFHYAINYLQREGVSQIALSPIGQIDFRWAEIAEPSRSKR